MCANTLLAFEFLLLEVCECVLSSTRALCVGKSISSQHPFFVGFTAYTQTPPLFLPLGVYLRVGGREAVYYIVDNVLKIF
jgi:hypothetical protein